MLISTDNKICIVFDVTMLIPLNAHAGRSKNVILQQCIGTVVNYSGLTNYFQSEIYREQSPVPIKTSRCKLKKYAFHQTS
jgi:hypothetical protein